MNSIEMIRCVVKFENDSIAHEGLMPLESVHERLKTDSELFTIEGLNIAFIALKKEAVTNEAKNIFLNGPEGYEYLHGPVLAVGISDTALKQITSLSDDGAATAKRLLSYLRDTSREGNKE